MRCAKLRPTSVSNKETLRRAPGLQRTSHLPIIGAPVTLLALQVSQSERLPEPVRTAKVSLLSFYANNSD